MSDLVDISSADHLERVVRRLLPYVRDGAIKRSRLDRVLLVVGTSDETRRRVMAALAVADIRVTADCPPPPTPAPAPEHASPASPPIPSRPRSVNGGPTGQGLGAVIAARRRIEMDRSLRHLHNVLLTAEEEAGL